ncbi:MAG: hypothetical protein A3K19_13560 [Lentisphaerae bacterium RIFOXYB12_FULL_65_16]|nr:MAG: hypothetical protein A3K18_02380 [Lentisphaerae bacterium RIFOXYA12_64_32]OGV93063.1 MAG: hypothetical protein A3K19_13560 [Lentisphaerae bacterium RIFOXYB12_FULL_65_16]
MAAHVLSCGIGEDWLPAPGTVPALPTAKAFSEIGWAVFADAQPTPNVICGFKCGDLGYRVRR